MGTRAGWGSPRVRARNQRLPARQTSPAIPSRPSTKGLPLQQTQVAGQLLVDGVVRLEEFRVGLAVQVADLGALLLHGLREGGVLGGLGAGDLEFGENVRRGALGRDDPALHR